MLRKVKVGFNGAAGDHPRKLLNSRELALGFWASMGPRVITRGNALLRRHAAAHRWLQWGRPGPGVECGFNGAAPVQQQVAELVASMGPRVITRGNAISRAAPLDE